MSQELIVVRQLPVIEERLRTLKESVDQRVNEAMSMVCTSETVLSIKSVRAELNKEFSEIETQRKMVKKAVLEPYERFEVVYKECVSDAFKMADAALRDKIFAVEHEMKRNCENSLRDYFSEQCMVHHIDFVSYERVGVVVSMADAKAKTQPPKKLREQISQFVERVEREMEMISGMEYADEITEVFRQTLDATRAIQTVQERHRRIEEERAARAAREATKSNEADMVKRVESFAPPVMVSVPEPTKMARVTFTVTDSIDRLKMLKQFLISNGFQYE